MSRISEIVKIVRPVKTYRFRIIILCLLAATIFWFFNALNESYSARVQYPLEFIYDTEKYVAVDKLPDEIQLNVNGLGWNLLRNNLGIKVTPVSIPLESPTTMKKISGTAVPVFIADQLGEFDLNFVITDTLSLNIDQIKHKLFFLKIDSAAISMEDSYQITSNIDFSPDTVRLEGPSTVLEELPDTLRITIAQKELDEDYNEILPIAINHTKASLINRNPPTVNVQFDVERFVRVSVSVPLVPVNLPKNTSITPEQLLIQYEIPESKESVPVKEDFEILLDYSKIDGNDSTITPEVVKAHPLIRNVSLDTTKIKVLFNE
ncbi:hypothetical protein FNH22_28115 [Fulvivirga sp. M361]|uniref:hypothetical protein n=1 Tax=Fulvivirga sp. M361 TaxID=2594266 RepID=UPI00117B2E5C|nr:hypothetical protein [Fulvivirga sp. M361]TRX48904.1 hypothetical protein FNH22_28115 [Fulvivirga sp. M361]